MKNNLKRFLCAAMVAVSSIFVGTVASAQQVNASLMIPSHSMFAGIPENTVCELVVEGFRMPVIVRKFNYEAVISKPAPVLSEEEALGTSTRKHTRFVPVRVARLDEYYSVVLEFDDKYVAECKPYAVGVEIKQEGKGLADSIRIHHAIKGTLILPDGNEKLCVLDLSPLFK